MRPITKMIWALTVVVAAAVFLSCTPKMGACYVENTGERTFGASDNGEGKQIRVFFDRTDSMMGFTQKGVETEYARALDSIWTLGEKIWNSGAVSQFYRFGERVISEVSLDTVQKAARTPSFYEAGFDFDKNIVKSGNNNQPFRSVVEYIKDLGEKQNCLNVVITDLYEQNGAHQYFHLLFQNAFENGMSGTLFAVKSAFKGRIHEINAVDRDASIQVDGYSTFFVFIVGDANSVSEYSKELKFDLKNKKLEYEVSAFVVSDSVVSDSEKPEKKYLWVPKESLKKFAKTERSFNSDELKYSMVNLKNKKLKSRDAEGKVINASVEAYTTKSDVGARYIVGIPVKNTDPSEFDYAVDLSLEYFSGEKTEGTLFSKFTPFDAEPGTFISSVIVGDNIPYELSKELRDDRGSEANTEYIYFTVETKNNKLKRGYYKINYSIRPTAKVPKWVEERSAATLSMLRESNEADVHIRVMNLNLIYADIDKVYNKVKNRDIHSGSFYLVRDI